MSQWITDRSQLNGGKNSGVQVSPIEQFVSFSDNVNFQNNASTHFSFSPTHSRTIDRTIDRPSTHERPICTF
jgi:hypothetical protein